MQKKSARVLISAGIALILSLTIFFAGFFRTETKAADSQGRCIGVDVSSHNGKIDWKTAKENGVDFAIIRIGYGDDDERQDDSFAAINMQGCEDAGIPYGVYIYSYAITEKEVDSEVSHTLRMIKGHDPELGIWFDMEDADGYKQYRHAFNPYTHGAELTGFCLQFVNAVKDKGYENVGVYANRDYFVNVLDYDKISDAGLIWLAHWGISSPSMDCAMWQFSDSGKVKGIPSTAVDMDMIMPDSPLYELIVIPDQDEPGDDSTSFLLKEDGTRICRGDVNGDDRIDVIDLAIVKKQLLGKVKLEGDTFSLADVNEDKEVDVIDLAQIKKHMLGKIDLFALAKEKQSQEESSTEEETTKEESTKEETSTEEETTTTKEETATESKK